MHGVAVGGVRAAALAVQHHHDFLVGVALGHVLPRIAHAQLRRHLPAVEVALVWEEPEYLVLHVGTLGTGLAGPVVTHGCPRVCHLLKPAVIVDNVLRAVGERLVAVPGEVIPESREVLLAADARLLYRRHGRLPSRARAR